MTDLQVHALVSPLSDLDRRRLIQFVAHVDELDPRSLRTKSDDFLLGLAACVHVRGDEKGN